MTRWIIKPAAAWKMVRELIKNQRGMIKQVSPASHRACQIIGYARLARRPDKYRGLFTAAYKVAVELEQIEEAEADESELAAHAKREGSRT